tara:strand:+ start:1122 stop:1421 length:300 start_codon:yes stop_codon:yes gene_type:complete
MKTPTQKTYSDWKAVTIHARRVLYGSSRTDASFWIAPSDWWSQNIKPALDAGEVLTLPVCRSIAANGGGFSLMQIDKHYQGQMPKVYYDNGQTITKEND